MSKTSASLGPAGRLSDLPAQRASATPDRRRWLILGTVGLAQLMVVLDATIVNIALPSAQRALGFTTVNRQWVVTAYALAIGSLLLFGGRLGDLIGRKITFLTGALGFAGASAADDAATSFGTLVAARAAQVVAGAGHAATVAGLARRSHHPAGRFSRTFRAGLRPRASLKRPGASGTVGYVTATPNERLRTAMLRTGTTTDDLALCCGVDV